MAPTPTNTIPAAEAARIVSAHASGGKYRGTHPGPVPTGGSRGKHASDETTSSLILDAYAAAELLAEHSDTWSPEHILAHPEIARLALSEALRLLPAEPEKPTAGRRRRTVDVVDPAEPLRRAAAVLAEAHDRISFLGA